MFLQRMHKVVNKHKKKLKHDLSLGKCKSKHKEIPPQMAAIKRK
jgi:hypothetical protein